MLNKGIVVREWMSMGQYVHVSRCLHMQLRAWNWQQHEESITSYCLSVIDLCACGISLVLNGYQHNLWANWCGDGSPYSLFHWHWNSSWKSHTSLSIYVTSSKCVLIIGVAVRGVEKERKVDGMRSRGKINPIFKITVCFVIHKAFEHTVLWLSSPSFPNRQRLEHYC